ncbi:MAG: hypothetical protein AAF613_08845 [Pseudomonadota bacterium]
MKGDAAMHVLMEGKPFGRLCRVLLSLAVVFGLSFPALGQAKPQWRTIDFVGRLADVSASDEEVLAYVEGRDVGSWVLRAGRTLYALPPACVPGRAFGDTGEGRDFGDKGEGREFGDTGQGRQFGDTGEGRDFGDIGQGREFGDTGLGREFGDTGQGREFGDTGLGREFGDTGEGREFGDTGQGREFGDTGQGRDFGDTGQGRDFGDTGEGRNFGSAGDGLDCQINAAQDDIVIRGQGHLIGTGYAYSLSDGLKYQVTVVRE